VTRQTVSEDPDRSFEGRCVMLRIICLSVLLLGLSGCEAHNPNFCPGSLQHSCLNIDAWDDGPRKCSGALDCTGPTAVCDLGVTNQCVACTEVEAGACVGVTPACVANTCQKCTVHTQCRDSRTCLPDGSCADVTQVAYVQAGGMGTVCTKGAPCGELADGVNVMRPYVKVQVGTLTSDKQTTIDGQTVMILADPGAKLTRTGTGTILEIVGSKGTEVAISDLEITGGLATHTTDSAVFVSNAGDGAVKLSLTRVKIDDNQGMGIDVTAGSLTLSRCVIARNKGGGLAIVGAEFDITNSMIVDNGSDGTMGSLVGGARLALLNTGNRRFDFNTVASNKAGVQVAGVQCMSVPQVTFSSNIVFDNQGSGQVFSTGNCSWSYSDIGTSTPGGVGVVPGTMNVAVDPEFMSPPQGDYRLQPTSQVKDAADPSTTADPDIDVDIEGDRRPQGAARDMGADEIKQ